MSFEATQWLWTVNDRIESTSEFAVLSFLCWKANPDKGNQVWHSQKKIAAAVKMSVSTVRRVLAALEKRGLIARGDQSLASRLAQWGRPVVWRIMCGTTHRHHDSPPAVHNEEGSSECAENQQETVAPTPVDCATPP